MASVVRDRRMDVISSGVRSELDSIAPIRVHRVNVRYVVCERAENYFAIRRPGESVVTLETALAESQLSGLFRIAVREKPHMHNHSLLPRDQLPSVSRKADPEVTFRSEEHTSELQSLRHLVCRL